MATCSKHYPTHYPRPHCVEQYPLDWWKAVVEGLRYIVEQIPAEFVEGLGLSGHMTALVYVDQNLEPLRPSMMIADTRSIRETEWLRQNERERCRKKTGNDPIEAFSVSKLLWIKQHEPELIRNSRWILFAKDYIRAKLTGQIATDPTDAGNSLLTDIHTRQWDTEWVKSLGLPLEWLPPILEPDRIAGWVTEEAARETGLKHGTPVVVGGADMACSQIGSGALEPTTLQITLSTSGQVVFRLPSVLYEEIGRITHHMSAIKDSLYGMGTIFTGGLGAEWVYRMLFQDNPAADIDWDHFRQTFTRLDNDVTGHNGILFFPFLDGSGSPYFDPVDRGAFLGLTSAHTKLDMLRAVLEGISFHIRESVEIYRRHHPNVQRITVGAGGSGNDFWCQMLADVIGLPIERLVHKDASAVGAALLAAIGIGWFDNLEQASSQIVKTADKFLPRETHKSVYDDMYAQYLSLYPRMNSIFKQMKNEKERNDVWSSI